MKLVEPIAVLDCYASGMGAVEILKGGNARFILYVEHTNEDGEVEHVIVQKTVMPLDSVPDAIALAWAACTGAAARSVAKLWPLMHIH